MVENVIRAIIFDLDGTLLDSFAVHFDAYVTMFAKFGIAMDEDLFWQIYSPNWFAVYETMGLAEKDWPLADKIWVAEVAKRDPQLFPGVMDMLKQLQDSYFLALVTSGSKNRVVKDLERTGLAPYFAVLVTGDDISRPKPDPEGLIMALDGLGLRANEAIYVGDTHEDRQAAEAAGMRFIGIENRILKPDRHSPFETVEAAADLIHYLPASSRPSEG